MPSAAARPVMAIVTSMDEYQTRVLAAAHDTLAQQGIPLIVHCDGPLDRGARSKLLVAMLREAAPVGIIELNSLRAHEQLELAELLSTLDVPIVHIGNRHAGAASVSGDNAGGMDPLLDHLLDERGARRPALLRGIPHHPDSIAREAAFRRAMQARGLVVDEDLVVTGEFMPEPAYDAMSKLLGRHRDFDAVVALNDMSAVSAVAALNDVGIRVPEDVAVTGFDNDLIASQWPGLTTVDQAFDKQGAVAASLLMDQIVGGVTDQEVVVPSRLIIRGSTAPVGSEPFRDVEEAVRIAIADKEQLAAQDASIALSDALNYCWTVEQVVEVIASHLHRLGVARCFLALHERRHDATDAAGTAARVVTEEARIVLAYRNGERITPPPHPVPSHRLLPPELARELDDGMLVLQPLAVLDRPLGYLLFDQTTGSARVTSLMRTELSRAIDAVLTTRDLKAHAHMLEQVVDRRTRELQAEVVTRQRAERELQRANAVLQRSAMLDGLTQIANRTAFDEQLERHWQAHLLDGRELALLMIDVDEFKLYNDHYGHLPGDEALRTVAECLDQAASGPDDVVCRYGGEEFSMILPGSGETAARAVSERFRGLLAAASIPHATPPVGPLLTASIGIAVGTPRPDRDPSMLLEAADRALYRAKAEGRDRIVISTRYAAPRPPVDSRPGAIPSAAR